MCQDRQTSLATGRSWDDSVSSCLGDPEFGTKTAPRVGLTSFQLQANHGSKTEAHQTRVGRSSKHCNVLFGLLTHEDKLLYSGPLRSQLLRLFADIYMYLGATSRH